MYSSEQESSKEEQPLLYLTCKMISSSSVRGLNYLIVRWFLSLNVLRGNRWKDSLKPLRNDGTAETYIVSNIQEILSSKEYKRMKINTEKHIKKLTHMHIQTHELWKVFKRAVSVELTVCTYLEISTFYEFNSRYP